jgi:hypothetical protein
LEKVGKTFFQSRRAKKNKIVNKISSKLEVLKRDGVKIVLAENNLENMTLLTSLVFLRSTRLLYLSATSNFKAKSNAHSMCAQEPRLHTYRTENGHKITNVTI